MWQFLSILSAEDIPALQRGRGQQRRSRRRRGWRRGRQQQLYCWPEEQVGLPIYPAGEAPFPPREGPEEGKRLLPLPLLPTFTNTCFLHEATTGIPEAMVPAPLLPEATEDRGGAEEVTGEGHRG